MASQHRIAVPENSRKEIFVLEGRGHIQDADGRLHPLEAGMALETGQIIVTGSNEHLSIGLPNGQITQLNPDSRVLIDEEPAQPPPAVNLAAPSLDPIIEALNSGKDLSVELDPTAAGLNAGTSNNEGNSFVRLERINEQLNPLQFNFPFSQGSSNFSQLNEPISETRVIVELALSEDFGRVKEDVKLSSQGVLLITGSNAEQAVFETQVDTIGTFGKFSLNERGEWTYTLNNSADNVQALAEGETKTETFTVQLADGTSSNVTITIIGTNDVANIGNGVGDSDRGTVQ
ncbi:MULTISPECIES: retention module-containing protein, partial [Deefgea]